MVQISRSEEHGRIPSTAGCEIDVATLDLALPGQHVRRVGVIVVDLITDELHCKINSASDDPDVAEMLAYLADDFRRQAGERGGKSVLLYLQDTLSNILRISDSRRIYADNVKETLNTLFDFAAVSDGPIHDDPQRPQLQTAPEISQILLVEDNPGDVDLIKEGFRQCSIKAEFTVASDGEEAMNLLRLIGIDVPVPDLVILDINVPKRSGLEVLESYRASEQLGHTPFAMLTSSFRKVDCERAGQAGASCYAVKAQDLDGLTTTISELITLCTHPAAYSVPPMTVLRQSWV